MKKLDLRIGHYTGCILCIPCKTRRRTGLLAAIRGVFDARSRRVEMLEWARFSARVPEPFGALFVGLLGAPRAI